MRPEGVIFRILLVLVLPCAVASAASPWPAEANTNAVVLTGVDAGLNTVNWSGAAWNPETRKLWLACNSGHFWALVEDGAGSFTVATNAFGTPAKWSPGGDLESICQADYGEDVVYLMDENGWIREYDVSAYGVVTETRNWDVRAECPEVGGILGPEAIAFVPDEWLAREGFRGTNGNLYVSTNGMGGLMFVGHQSGGYVHAFDLDPDSSAFAYVGRFKTGQSETAGLEFDRTAGQLYVWHNTGSNFLEVTELNSYVDGSDRRLRQMAEYYGPRSGNLEGFAMLPLDETNNWCFITDDDNSGGEAVVWYREFEPSEDTDSDSLPDGWELWHFGTATQTVGDADSDLDGMINVGEYTAGTEPTNAASVLSILPLTVLTNALALSWPSVSGRVYAIWQAGAVASGFTQVVEEAIAATAPLNCSTVDVPEAVSGMLYRISVEAP